MSEEFGFAPPPFKPDEALQKLRRELRELGLTEREGLSLIHISEPTRPY